MDNQHHDQYKRIDTNVKREIFLFIKKYLLYPLWGMEKTQKSIRAIRAKTSFLAKYPRMVSDRVSASTYPVPGYEKLYFIIIPKVAGSSILKTILPVETENLDELSAISLQKKMAINNLPDLESKQFFAFVRNPFSRIVSCYTDRVLRVDCFRYFGDGRLAASHITDFREFVKKIAVIPDDISDIHFCSQSYLLSTRDGSPIPNCYIGHFETLVEDFEPLRQKYGFAELEHVNKSSKSGTDWRDYYDQETAELVYNRYRKDFESYGYKDEFQKLKDYFNGKISTE